MLTTKMMVIAMIGMMLAVGAIPLLDAEETDADSNPIMLFGMGLNSSGQLGIENIDPVLNPTRIGDFTDLEYVSPTDNNTLFIDSGCLYGMGRNNYGQLGTGKQWPVYTPTRIGDFTNVTDVWTTNFCSLFIDSGRLYGMGQNSYGQLGTGNTDIVLTPTRIGDFTNVTSVYANGYCTVFIDSGCLYGIGRNDRNQLGIENTDPVLTPTRIGDFSNVTSVYHNGGSSVFIDSGRLYGMGQNNYGQLGTGNTDMVRVPTRIGDFSNVTSVSLTDNTTVFIDSGRLYGIGLNRNGELGIENTHPVLTPTRIGDFTNVAIAQASNSCTLIVDSGRLYGTGLNNYGQLGTGNINPVLTPTRIGDFTNVTNLYESPDVGIVFRALFIDSGRLYGMGQNNYGQLGTGNTDEILTPTRIGDFANVIDVYTFLNTTFVKLNGVYTATIESNNVTYGTVSQSSIETIEYGTAIGVSGNTLTIGTNTVTATPTTETAYYTYAFDGWYVGSTPLVTGTVVNDNMTITAQFTETPKPFTASISANPPDAGSVSVDSITVPYGSVMTVNGQTLTVGGTTVTATVKDSDTQYTYAWIGWMYNGQPVVSGTTAISGTAPITASMSKEVTTYTVTWIYGPASERITETETYAYGETPSHADPPALSEIEPFKEWSPAISPVTGSITYTAVYSDPAEKAPSMIILVLPYIVAVGMIIATAGMINSRNEGKWEKGDYLQLIIGLTISVVALATILIPLCNVLA